MNLEHLSTFVAIVERGSLSAAARAKRISQPAVTKQLQRMEAEIGLPLLVRGPKRRVELTPAGERLLAFARETLARYEVLEQDLAHVAVIDHVVFPGGPQKGATDEGQVAAVGLGVPAPQRGGPPELPLELVFPGPMWVRAFQEPLAAEAAVGEPLGHPVCQLDAAGHGPAGDGDDRHGTPSSVYGAGTFSHLLPKGKTRPLPERRRS